MTNPDTTDQRLAAIGVGGDVLHERILGWFCKAGVKRKCAGDEICRVEIYLKAINLGASCAHIYYLDSTTNCDTVRGL